MFTIILLTCVNCKATTLIVDQNTRNGSFETGQLEQWFDPSGRNRATVIDDALFASDGSYYLEMDGIGPIGMGVAISQYLCIDENAGATFTFSIDAKNGIYAFDELRVSIYALTLNGYIYGSADKIFIMPTEAANGWVTFTGTENFSQEEWQDVRVLYFIVGYCGGGLGFLDNIILAQIPEPITILFFGIGGLIVRRKR